MLNLKQPILNRVMTQSRLKRRAKCSESDNFRSRYGLSDFGGNALDFGLSIHDATEHFYLQKSSGVTDEASLDSARRMAFSEMQKSSHKNPRDVNKARAAITAYINRWCTKKVQPFDELVHDSAFDAPIPELEFGFSVLEGEQARNGCLPGWTVAGKCDAVARQKSTGHLYLREMKTTSDKSVGYFSKLWADLQICLYIHDLEVELGEKIHGVLYDVIQKIGIRGSAKETDEEFEARCVDLYQDRSMLVRELIAPPQHMIESALFRRMHEMRMVEINESEGVFPRNTESCYPAFGGWSCAYTAICQSPKGLDDPMALNGLQYKRPNSELSENFSVTK